MKKNLKISFRNLELLAKFLVKTHNQGIHWGLFPSNTGDIDLVREYVPGDKRLDCRSSLRTGKVMSRTFSCTSFAINDQFLLTVSNPFIFKTPCSEIIAYFFFAPYGPIFAETNIPLG